MVPDMRPVNAITADTHAVATYRGLPHLVRGITEFTHLATREPAATVWIAHALRGAQPVTIALSDITIRPGRTS